MIHQIGINVNFITRLFKKYQYIINEFNILKYIKLRIF